MHNIINDNSLVLGIMSGTSMDGLDISCARYFSRNNRWNFELICAETFLYSDTVKLDLRNVFNKELDLDEMDIKFGNLIADYVEIFTKKFNLNIDLISSHGHTIFHDPKNNYTKQIGLGSIIARKLKVPVVSNFRQQDVWLGGQGAPLVPIGDEILFGQYDSCLNLGGICNISFNYQNSRVAFDISPCNLILNYFAQKEGKDYDKKGIMASKGIVNNILLTNLNNIDYYRLTFPKSLANEDVKLKYLPLIKDLNISNIDVLATFVEHIALQIASILNELNISNCLISGGGAFNNFLIYRISHYASTEFIFPSDQIINYKESIIFGFLGVLRVLNQNNCLASVTGAKRDHCSGDLYLVEC